MQHIIGIYKITSPTNKIYIGQSVNILGRFRRYTSPSKSQKALYNSFEKYGVTNHIFEIVEECLESELNVRERYWQDYYDVTGPNGLNCRLTKTNDKSGVMSQETKEKIKKAQKGKLLGRKASDETKEKMRHSRLGFRYDQKIKDKMSKLKHDKKMHHSNNKLILDLNSGIFYYSIIEAANTFSLNKQTLSSWLTGKTKNKKPNLILV